MRRADFLRRAGGLFALAVIDRRSPARLGAPGHPERKHPDPRPGINADHVLKPADLDAWSKKSEVMDAYAAARDNPAIFDGIACACGCSDTGGEHRSLLVCYETQQPTGCAACREASIFVGKLAAERKTLDDIRKAFDKKFD
jgi:hypothetical protein